MSALFWIAWSLIAVAQDAPEPSSLEVVSIDELDDAGDERPFGSPPFLLGYLALAGFGLFIAVRTRDKEEE